MSAYALTDAIVHALCCQANDETARALSGRHTLYKQCAPEVALICSPALALRTRESLNMHCRISLDRQNYNLADCLTASEKS